MSLPRGASVVLLAVALMLPVAAHAAADTIPHERFDQAELDLLTLKLLLDYSLVLARESVISCVGDNIVAANLDSLNLVESIRGPATIVEGLSEEVDSYDSLLTFIPPFETLAHDDQQLVGTYTLFFENLTTLRMVAASEVLPPEVYENALTLLARTNAYVAALLHQLNQLEDDATAIQTLPEIPGQGLLNVQPLLDAIELLRGKLRDVETELEDMAELVLNPEPRLFLLLNSDEYYLGQTMIMTGYLFYMGLFIEELDVFIERDGDFFEVLDTGHTGKFVQTYTIAFDGDELGEFVFRAWAEYETVLYWSENVTVTILKVPTVIEIDVELSYRLDGEQRINGSLKDYRGSAMAGQTVTVRLDSRVSTRVTDGHGRFSYEMNTSSMTFGEHTIRATYGGNETHEQSTTKLHVFTLKYSAELTIDLSSTEVPLRDSLEVSGSFSNESDEQIPGANITIVLDGQPHASVSTTSNGTYLVVIDTERIGPGSHSIYSEHDDEASPFAYTRSEELVFVVEDGEGGGFFPGVVGGTEELVDAIKEWLADAFFGEWAWLAWTMLIILSVLAYLAYRKLRERSAERRRKEEDIKRALLYEPKIVTSAVRPLSSLPRAESKKLAKAKLWKIVDALLMTMSPRDAIVHGYQKFLQFLGTERSTAMDECLTHREIQTELVFMGYPKDPVRDVTSAYEKAMYTTEDVSVEDVLGFADSLATLEGYGKVVLK